MADHPATNPVRPISCERTLSEKKLHFGIIGAGRIGRVHAKTLAFRLPQAQTIAIADLNREAAESLAAHCGIPRVAESGSEIIADPAIEAVLICSPTETHADFIVEAAKAGKHIFCEKPIAHSLDEIDRALAASMPTLLASASRWRVAKSALRISCTSSAATPRPRRSATSASPAASSST
jgi:hypothetical protein